MERDLIESGAGRGEYVTYREHMTAKEEAQKRFAALELQQATMHAALMHIPEKLDKLTEAVAAMGNKPAQAQSDTTLTQAAAAMHRAAEAMSKQQPHSNLGDILEIIREKKGDKQGGGKVWALVGVLVGAVGILLSLLINIG